MKQDYEIGAPPTRMDALKMFSEADIRLYFINSCQAMEKFQGTSLDSNVKLD